MSLAGASVEWMREILTGPFIREWRLLVDPEEDDLLELGKEFFGDLVDPDFLKPVGEHPGNGRIQSPEGYEIHQDA